MSAERVVVFLHGYGDVTEGYIGQAPQFLPGTTNPTQVPTIDGT